MSQLVGVCGTGFVLLGFKDVREMVRSRVSKSKQWA